MKPTKRHHSALVMALLVASNSFMLAQKVFSARELDVVEKTLGEYFDAATKAASEKDHASAKVKLMVAHEYLARSWTFWRMNKKPDAEQMVTVAVARLENLDDALSKLVVDWHAVDASIAAATAACAACHEVYRTQDPVTHAYTIKQGSIE